MLKEALELHNNLNPALWTKNDELLPEVEDRINKIVSKFQSECMLPLDIVDVHLVGSNASYNYNKYSDLDVHIVVNFDLVACDKEILIAAYNLQKAQFNKDYDISIHGVNVEMYIEDINAGTMSNGIYSLYEKRWIKKPQKIQYPKLDARFDETVTKLSKKIRSIIDRGDIIDITQMINRLYMMRKNSLAADGEFGAGNLLFKEIRNLGLLNQLKDRLKGLQSKDLTLEALNESKWSHKQIELNGRVYDVNLPVGYKDALDLPTKSKNSEASAIAKFVKLVLNKPDWVMHHKNHDGGDNNPSNLQLIPKEAHLYIHNNVLPIILNGKISSGLTAEQAIDSIRNLDNKKFLDIVIGAEQNALSKYSVLELSHLTIEE